MTPALLRSRVRSALALLVLLLCVALALAVPAPRAEATGQGHGHGNGFATFRLTLLHHNDGESQLLGVPGQPEFGNVARFATLADQLREEATRRNHGDRFFPRRGALLLTSGDNFLAGPEFSLSLERGVPFYDAIALDHIGYDAFTIGNHEFDFGPDVLADFIESFEDPPPFLSANLDVSAEPRLAALAARGDIVSSTVVRERGRRIGIIGLTTPELPSISSPRNVVVRDELAQIVQAEADRLSRRGVGIIILSSHLQAISEEQALVPQLRGVDIVVAGGGGELLADEGDLLVPGDEAEVFGAYPQEAVDRRGRTVPIVTTSGDYAYLGRLIADFDIWGNLLSVDEASGPVRVSGVAPDAVAPDPQVQADVIEPVQAGLEELAETVVGTSEVALDGTRAAVRSRETNLGNLITDAFLARATALAPEFGAPLPDVALQNGGGIRNDSVLPAGPITELDTFDILPFSNFLSVVPDVPREQFEEILENAVSRVEVTDGRFAQVGGFRFTYDPAGQAQVVDDAGTVLTPGSRIVDVVLDDGTVIVEDGVVVPGDPLNIATIDFSARGGDQYPFRGAPFITLGVSYQQALRDYIAEDLGGVIPASEYPEGGEGRITTVP